MMIQKRITTGSKELDRILSGGITTNAVTFIYGEPSSGKTTFVMSVASNYFKIDHVGKVVYIDSDSKFNIERFTQILKGDTQVLKRLLFLKPSSFEDQASILQVLPQNVEDGDLVILDSVTSLYRLDAGDPEKTFVENKELNYQLGFIKEMVESQRVTFLITGQVRSVFDSVIPQVEPVAPRLLNFWSDYIIKLEKTPIEEVRRAYLEKPRRGMCRFSIGLTGVTEVEPRW